jgi:PDZ domain-containing secreted protein
MAKKKAKKKAAKKKACRESLVVASKVKAYIKSKKMMTSSDALCAISDQVYALLDDAIARTKANKRSTVKPQDL